MTAKPKLLVHLCCAPDALYVLGLLQPDHDVSGFFYNPNIHPPEEYRLRLEETHKVADILKTPVILGDYHPEIWHRLTAKYVKESEKGWRCNICYSMRLHQTAREALRHGFDKFGTVMSLSPWKKAEAINRTGKMFGRRLGIEFLEADFKKKDGFKKSIELSRTHGLYRQNYCGCIHSMR